MAQTSTGINGCDVAIWLDKAGGTLTDISGSSNKIDLNFDQELAMFRTFGSKWPKRLECGKDASFALDVIYSSAADEGLDILKDWFFATDPGARTLKIYVPDKNVGSDVYSCEVRIENLTFSAEAGAADPIMVSASLLPDGEVTLVTNAT